MRVPRRYRWQRRGVLVALWASLACNVLLGALFALAFALPLPSASTSWSRVVEYRDGRPAFVFLSDDDKWRLRVSLDAVEPKLVEALIALEDKRFWDHDGVDPLAVARATWTDVTRMRRVSGASTISMQLARLLEPRPRTIRSKLIEMFRATQIDLRMTKREILEAYLSRTPYGGNVEGIESASWKYFGHGAKHLTPLEIATLLAVPQGPSRFSPKPANLARLRARRDLILNKLVIAGVFTGVDAETALAEARDVAPPERMLPMPREAPHAAWALRKRFPDAVTIRSTLDGGLQAIVERTVALRAPELERRMIYSGAVVVADHRTREIVALVGSLDWRGKRGGQIAMFDRPRSPGSTLKPVLYALAIERGMVLPQFLVPDVPVQYGTYRPKNFDGDFLGLVTLREALSRSLNVPFVDLLDAYGIEQFVGELQRMGVAPARTLPGEYGLSLIAGGIEMTPLELAGVYATLAGDGEYRPLRLHAGDEPGTPMKMFGAGAAWLTRQTLSLLDRPDFPRRRALTGAPADIHWKTGTSFGFRDAWAVGSGPAYTAVVWTGNVDNAPSADLIGSEAAGPLLFDVLEGVAGRDRVRVPHEPPAELESVAVCAYSGHIASPACEHTTSALAPVHAVPTTPCPYHHAYDVDRATGRAVLPACRRSDRDYERKSFLVLPSAVAAWLTDRNRAVPAAPLFDEACTAQLADAAPEITSPSEGHIVTLLPGVPAKNQSVPLAATTRAATLSWFVDGELIATAPSSQRVHWIPSVGKHVIVVSDEAGRKARRVLVVHDRLMQSARLP